MKQFIKFTNARVFATADHVRAHTYDEFIVDVDTIESVTTVEGNHVVVLILAFMITENYHTKTERNRIDVYITDEDYEMVKQKLLEPFTVHITGNKYNEPSAETTAHERESDANIWDGEVVEIDHEDMNLTERAVMEEALNRAGGRRKQAAALLGISERTLYRKMKIYGL